jgi:hypothetical protein
MNMIFLEGADVQPATFDLPDPARYLGLGGPVIRWDGIPVDRVTWAALLTARLLQTGKDRDRDRAAVPRLRR